MPLLPVPGGNHNNLTFKMPFIAISDGTWLIVHTYCKKCDHEFFHNHNNEESAAGGAPYMDKLQSELCIFTL